MLIPDEVCGYTVYAPPNAPKNSLELIISAIWLGASLNMSGNITWKPLGFWTTYVSGWPVTFLNTSANSSNDLPCGICLVTILAGSFVSLILIILYLLVVALQTQFPVCFYLIYLIYLP